MTLHLRIPAELRQACDEARAKGRRVGLVPTMGALHQGHFSLIEKAKENADFVVVTIFVNPLQFAPGEDLDRYPRALSNDLESCATRDVDVVFSPEADSMYPPDFQSTVSVDKLTTPLEGRFRPSHFSGVTTVVAKLFNLVGPSVAMFGRKDYQQWKVLERMVRDLDMPIEVVGCPIIREPDGMALSSRNRYLSAAERERALAIVSALRDAHDRWERGEHRAEAIRAGAAERIRSAMDRVDYVAAVDPDSLEDPDPASGRLLIAVAAHLGRTRLIDNVVLGEDPRP